MYPTELEIKDTTESNNSASYLDILPSFGRDGQMSTSLANKRDDFNFHIMNFPFRVAIFHLCKLIDCLSRSSYGLPRLAPIMKILFSERLDFHVCFSGICQGTFGIVPQEVLWSIWGSHQSL